ncbi:Serine/threonine-protein kinase rio2 [Thecaphora frezii]
MRLDATDLRYISAQEFRALTAIEMGSKNHEVVPSSLAAQISGLHHSGINKLFGSLAKRKLIARVQNAKYDGYRLTYGGYDFLALRTFSKRETIAAVGRRIGVGKESDINIVESPEGESRVLKIHRLGRISFRAIKEKRDYMGKRKSASWMYMSRLAAAKEYAFMQILHQHGFPVPTPIDQARHCIVMSHIDAFPLRQIAVLPPGQIPLLYSALMKLIVRLARVGLIHGDFNEFNLLIREIKNGGSDDEYDSDGSHAAAKKGPRGRAAQPETKKAAMDQQDQDELVLEAGQKIEKGNGFERVVQDPSLVDDGSEDDESDADSHSVEEDEDEDSEEELDQASLEEAAVHLGDDVVVEPILIDFPQMVSVEHPNAEYYFDRDVECVRRFFRKRFRYHSDEFPRFRDIVPLPGQGPVAKPAADGADPSLMIAGEAAEEQPRLDILAKASGYGKSTKQEQELESYMSQLRLQAVGDWERVQLKSDDDDDEDDDDKEDDEDDDSAQASDGESQSEDGESNAGSQDADERRRPRPKKTSTSRPSRGAAKKAAADGDDRLLAQIVASDRARAARKAEKHNGRRAQAGKAGRAHAGGKAKTSKSRMVKDSSVF